MSQPLNSLGNGNAGHYATADALAVQLAELEERTETGHSSSDADATVINLKAELDTFADALQRKTEPSEYELESACGRVTEMVKAIGRSPEDLSEITIDRPNGASGNTVSDKPAASDEQPLGNLGVYELMTKLGEGGMGAVYKARHTKLDKIVAIKVLPSERMKDKNAVARFEREMRAVGKLEHPNIVRAMDANEEGGMHYLVMEYVQGLDLSQLGKSRGPLPIADACELIRQAAVGLDEAHENGMVHRDIKPSNIMLCVVSRRKPPVVKVLDMGLALLSDAHSSDAGLTTTGQMMGTLDYMAPEQGGDSKNVDIRADIYSLGATLYRLLCGEAIYHGEKYQTPVQKMMALATEAAPSIQNRRVGIPDGLATIVHRMLEKDPSKRFDTPEEVAQALAPYCEGANLGALLSSAGVEGASSQEVSHSIVSASPSQAERDTAVSIDGVQVKIGATVGDTPAIATGITKSLVSTNAKIKKPAPRTAAGGRKSPPWLPLAIGGGLLGLGAIVLAAIMVFYVQTPNGTLRVEINDPSIEVLVKGSDIVLKQADREEISLTPGEKTLIVKRGDFTFETDKLVLKKGAAITVQVELVRGEIQVAMAGGPQLGRAELPQANAAQQLPSNLGTERSAGLLFDGRDDYVVIPSLKYDGSHPITIEAWVVCRQVRDPGGIVASLNSPKENKQFSLLAYGDQESSFWAAVCFDSGTQFNSQQSSRLVTLNRRVHLAAVLNGEQPQLFIDGKSFPDSWRGEFSKTFEQEGLLIGCDNIVGGRPDAVFDGSITAVRVSKFVRYDKDFTPLARLEKDKHTLALYHFDEGSGDVLKDSSGNNHHGKIVGAKWVKAENSAPQSPSGVDLPAGKFALSFDHGDKVVVEKVPFRETTIVTIEAWVAVDLNDDDRVQTIVKTPNGEIGMKQRALRFYTHHGYVDVPDVVPSQRRVHVAGVNDGKVRRVYLNGKMVGKTDDPGVVSPNQMDFELRIGWDVFRGVIDAVRVSSTARYDKDFTPPADLTKEDDTFAMYLFNEGQGDVLRDSSGNNHHGKIVGAKWVRTSAGSSTASPAIEVPLASRGAASQHTSLAFDGIDDVVAIPTLRYDNSYLR